MSVNYRKLGRWGGLTGVKFHFNCGCVEIDSGGQLPLSCSRIKLHDLKRWAHDEICQKLFGGENQQSLQSINGFLNDCSGVSTPDHITIMDGPRVKVYEVKTTMLRSSAAYTSATRQYIHVLRSANWDYDYLCLGASPESVTWDSGFDLSETDFQFIIHVMQVFENCQKELLDLGIKLEDYIITGSLITIPPVDLSKDCPLSIDDQMIKDWIDLDVEHVSGTSLMLEAMKQVPEIDDVRFRDEQTLKSMYNSGVVNNDLPFKIGMLIPTVGSNDLFEAPIWNVQNSKLRELCKTYLENVACRSKPSIKINLKETRLGDMNMDDEDVRRGLWSGILRNKHDGIFREHKVKDKDHEPRKRSFPRFLEMQVNKDRGWKAKRYSPMEIDLEGVVQNIFKFSSTNLLEADQTTVEGARVSLPFQREFWFQSTKFWQRLVEEINIGRYSSQGKWNRFHCHRILPYDAWLFVHGTGLHSHQFYYLVFHTKDRILWPNNLSEMGQGWWYTSCIKSLKTDRINQHLNILEKLVSLRFYWQTVFEENARSLRHFATSLLIAFDSKQATIDTLSLFRYVYMEFCKSADNRNPAKIVSKLPLEIRSPVLAWIIKRMRELVLNTSMLQPKLKRTKQNTSRMNFKGLVSWIDFQPIKNFNVILSLSYMHYATSHPVSMGLHGKIQIMSKLLREEKKLAFDQERMSRGSIPLSDIRPHEYSAEFVKKIAQVGSKRLLYVYPDYRVFFQVLSSKLQKLKLSDFATFKKSTIVDGQDPGQRAYCFEEILKLIDKLNLNPLNASNYSPYCELRKLTDYQVAEPKNRNVSIFVKDQQTGLREIFVLPINFRILVKSMEVFARIVNETFPNETLSYPKRKDLVVAEHIRKSQMQVLELTRNNRTEGTKVILLRYSSSSDAKAWCQQFCMPVFGCFITNLLYSAYGDDSLPLIRYFCLILNQITGKHIHVDKRVKEWLKTAENVKTDNSTLSDLINMYQGKAPGLYDDESIINMSNMMQGIPHETSSSLHASYLLFSTMVLKSLIIDQLSKRMKFIKLGNPIIDSLVSSDDSGILFSLPVLVSENAAGHIAKAHEIELLELKKALYKMGYSIELNKRLFSADVSIEKSTIFAETPVFEFNSKFYIGKSIATAEIKFVVSPLTLGFHTRIIDRINEALSSLKGCVKEGIRQDQLMIIQQCLRRMHIRFLYSDWWNDELVKRIDLSQSPRIGLLPLVRKGLIGFLNLSTLSDYSLLLKSKSYEPIRESVLSMIEETEVYSLTLRVGRKYQHVLSKMGISREFILSELERLSIDPLRFLRREIPESLLIYLKLMSPGARIALSFVDLSKIHMASCYASNTDCILTKSGEKVTLLKCLEDDERLGAAADFTRDFITDFPSELRHIKDILDSGYEVSIDKDQTRISTEIVFSEERRDYLSLLIKCWETGFSYGEQKVLEQIQGILPSVKDTITETLKEFDSVFDLETKIRCLDQRSLVINVLSFISGSKRYDLSYLSYLQSNWSRNNSLIIASSAVNRVRRERVEKNNWVKWKIDLQSQLSNLSGSIRFPAIDRFLINNIKTFVEESSHQIEEKQYPIDCILMYLSKGNKAQRINLRNFKCTSRMILGYKRDEILIYDRRSWYQLRYEVGSWILYKDEQSPRLSYIDCVYKTRDPVPIWIEPADLRIKIDKYRGLLVLSNHWFSDCDQRVTKAFPKLRISESWLQIEPDRFDFGFYLDNLPPEFTTDICLKLLSASHLDLDVSAEDFSFWVMVSDIIVEETFTKEEKSLARAIMSIATDKNERIPTEYDPFLEEFIEEMEDLGIEDITKALLDEMMDLDLNDMQDEEDVGQGSLAIDFDFGDWNIEDILESYKEKRYQPENSPALNHWRIKLQASYEVSFMRHIRANEHNLTRKKKIEDVKGRRVLLNPEHFGRDFPD